MLLILGTYWSSALCDCTATSAVSPAPRPRRQAEEVMRAMLRGAHTSQENPSSTYSRMKQHLLQKRTRMPEVIWMIRIYWLQWSQMIKSGYFKCHDVRAFNLPSCKMYHQLLQLRGRWQHRKAQNLCLTISRIMTRVNILKWNFEHNCKWSCWANTVSIQSCVPA